MKITDVKPNIRFLDKVTYTINRGFTKTYDCRFIYVLSGEGSIYVNRKEYEIKTGLLILFQAGTLYRLSPKPSFLAVVVDFDFTDKYKDKKAVYSPIPKAEFNRAYMHENIRFEDAEVFNSPLAEYDSFYLEVALLEIVKEYNEKRPFYEEKSSNLLKNIFLDIARRQFCKEKPLRLAASVVEYIYNNYRNDVSNKALAKIFNYDSCYLNRVVKSYTGLSLHSFVLKHRVETGVKLLLTTNYTLEEIAEETGFFSASHFSLRCKERTGHSPSYYRKR